MKRSYLVLIFLICCQYVYAQPGDSIVPFIAKSRVDWEGGTVSESRFFSIHIPSNFEYDSAWNNANGHVENNFFQIHSEVHYDYEEFLGKVFVGGKYDLRKYALIMTKEHFTSLDSCIITDIKKETIREVNGIPTLKINYSSKETFLGYTSEKKYILYLIPMYPKDSRSFDINYQQMVFLFFSCFNQTDDKVFNLFADNTIKTIKPL